MQVSQGFPGLSDDVCRNLRQAARAFAADGHQPVVWFVRGQGRMRLYHDIITRAYVKRNEDTGRPVDLDSFHQAFGVANELALLVINDRLTAWDLLQHRPPVTRILAGQMVTRWKRYRPGTLLETFLLARAAASPECQLLDRGEGYPEKLLALA